MSIFENFKNEINVSNYSENALLKIECICAFVDTFIELIDDGLPSVTFFTNNDELRVQIVIDSAINKVITENDIEFVELCKLSDSIKLSGIQYDIYTDNDEDETGIVIEFLITHLDD